MRSVRSQITLTYILISLVVLSLLSVLLSYEIERYYFDRLLSSLQTETSVLAALVQEGARRRASRAEAQKDLNVFASAARMRITLIDSSGVVIYDSSVPDSLLHSLDNHSQRLEIVEARQVGTGSNVRTSATVHEDLVYVARKVDLWISASSAFPHLQFVRVSVGLGDVKRVMYEIRFKIVVAAIAVLAVVLLVSQFVARRMAKPLVEIGEMVKEIKAGNLDQKLPVRSQDELGRLAELINELTDKLKTDIEQLQKLERVRSEFLANVSHELRTPIFSLKGFLETLQEGAINDPAVNKKFVEKAYHHANRLDSLLSDLIEISRIESGDMKMSFRYFDVVSFLRQIVGDFSDNAAKKQQRLLLDAPEGEALVLGDKDRLRLAIGNIIDNAIKYSPESTTIIARLTEQNHSVTISVSDNGPGIEAEHLPRVFERFYRVDKTRSREVGGTGLGLAIVKHIVEAHNSKVSVTSEVGKGTTFSFDLKK
jgi:two-component system phosphate regulon sensor histidine kinase PhoR